MLKRVHADPIVSTPHSYVSSAFRPSCLGLITSGKSSGTSSSAADQPQCNDDGCGGMPSCAAGNRPSVGAALSPGLYYFMADGYLGVSCECGNYSYDISGL